MNLYGITNTSTTIRFALYAKVYSHEHRVIEVRGGKAMRVKPIRDLAEYWVWCHSSDSLALLLSELLSRGILPVALGLLTGQVTVLEYVNIVDLVREGTLSTELCTELSVKDEIEVEKVCPASNVDTVIKKLLSTFKITELSFTIPGRRVKLKLQEEVPVSKLFDAMLRTVKPVEIPVSIDRLIRLLNSLLSIHTHRPSAGKIV